MDKHTALDTIHNVMENIVINELRMLIVELKTEIDYALSMAPLDDDRCLLQLLMGGGGGDQKLFHDGYRKLGEGPINTDTDTQDFKSALGGPVGGLSYLQQERLNLQDSGDTDSVAGYGLLEHDNSSCDSKVGILGQVTVVQNELEKQEHTVDDSTADQKHTLKVDDICHVEQTVKVSNTTKKTKKTNLPCSYCEKTFATNHALVNHTRMHTGERPYKCAICDKKFKQVSHRNDHQKRHIRDKPFKCDKCLQPFKMKSDLARHKERQCKGSDESGDGWKAKDRRWLVEHGDLAQESNEYSEQVHRGGKFIQGDLLNESVEMSDEMSETEAGTRLESAGIDDSSYLNAAEDGMSSLTCSYCEKTFNNKSVLITHIRMHTGERPYKCGICDMRFKQTSHRNAHQRIHAENKRACDICGVLVSDLKKHQKRKCCGIAKPSDDMEVFDFSLMNQHSMEPVAKPFECTICNTKFKWEHTWQKHVQKHSDPNCEKCDICGKVVRDMARHKLFHTGEKPYVCSYCSKSFATSDRLITHTRKHTEGKPYQCAYCDQRFGLEDAKRKHEERHEAIYGGKKKLHLCTLCGKQYTNPQRLRDHIIAVHRQCHVCDETFPEAAAVIDHLSSVHGIKGTHACPICKKVFGRPAHVAKHMVIHTKEKPYPCKFCHYRYNVKSNVMAHMRERHGYGKRREPQPVD